MILRGILTILAKRFLLLLTTVSFNLLHILAMPIIRLFELGFQMTDTHRT